MYKLLKPVVFCLIGFSLCSCKTNQSSNTMSVQLLHSQAKISYNTGQYVEAAKLILPLAQQGDAKAQLKLGISYEFAFGVPQDYKEAAKWYRLSADQGDGEAQYSLGGLYALGKGVSQDLKEAEKWYRKAAAQGHRGAQHKLEHLNDVDSSKYNA